MRSILVLVLLAACGGRAAPPTTPAATPTTTAAVTPAATPATAPAAACTAAEHRQLDFWIGDWDLVVKTRTAPGKDEWTDAPATQHVESILGGCAISEHFVAQGWAGNSYSSWQPAQGKWRQTWVDDQASYLAFTGGVEAGGFALYGEPFQANGKTVQMRMVFKDVTATTLRWEWQRTIDAGATWSAAMVIEYKRRS